MQGFVHLWHHDPELAGDEFQTALKLARQIGDITNEARILTYVTVCYRMRGLVEEARQAALQGQEAAVRAGMPEYQGSALANLSWVSWRLGNLAEAKENAVGAIEGMESVFQGRNPMKWMAVLQLLAMAQSDREFQQAIDYDRMLLDPDQLRLPDPLEEALNQAILCWEGQENEEVILQLNRAVELAKEYGYL